MIRSMIFKFGVLTLYISSFLFSFSQVETKGDNSPAVVAEKFHTSYGLDPRIIRELIEVYDKEGKTPQERNQTVEVLIKKYNNLEPTTQVLSDADKVKLGITGKSRLEEIFNWDLFLKKAVSTSGKNSPAVYAPHGYVEIWYGITPEAFKGIFTILENKQAAIEGLGGDIKAIRKQLAKQVKKFKELEKELASRMDYDEVARKAKALLDKGDIDGAEKILEEDALKANKDLAYRNFEVGKVKELNLKYGEATRYYQLAAMLDTGNVEYSLYYGKNLLEIAKNDEAIIYFRKSLKGLENLSKIDSSEIAIRYNELGLAYNSKGEYNTAISYYQKGLRIDTTVLGKNHPSIAINYNNIGLTHYNKGEYDMAIFFFQEALKINKTVFGNNNPSVATTLNNLGLIYESKGEYDAAISFYHEALKIDTTVNGKNHPNVATNYNNLGLTYSEKGEYDKAISYFKETLRIFQKVYGGSHPKVAIGYNSLGFAYNEKGEYDQAISFYHKALQIDSLIYEKDHPDLASLYNNLGVAYKEKEEHNRAIFFYQEALRIFKKVYGESHVNIATSYSNLGGVYQSLEEYDQAISFYHKALRIDTVIYGKNHPSVAIRYNNLGSAFDSKEEYEKAVEYYKEAVTILKVILGEFHPYLSTTYNNLGSTYYDKGSYDQAIQWYQKALKIDLKFYEDTHPYVLGDKKYIGRSLTRYGIDFYQNNQSKKAINYLLQALKIHEEIGDSTYLALCSNNLGASYLHLQNPDSGLVFVNNGIRIAEVLIKKSSPKIKEPILGSLYLHKASCLNQMGRKKEAKEIFKNLISQAKKEKDLEFLKEIKAEMR